MSFSDISTLDHAHMNYAGFQVRLNVQFGKMKDRIHIDVGVGDVVEPDEKYFKLMRHKEKPIFEELMSLQFYPVETIFSEKLEAIISRRGVSSRMKDFHDVILITRENNLIDNAKLKASIDNTFQNRKTEKEIPIRFTEEEFAQLQQHSVHHLQLLGSTIKTMNFSDDEEITHLLSFNKKVSEADKHEVQIMKNILCYGDSNTWGFVAGKFDLNMFVYSLTVRPGCINAWR